MSDVLVNIEKLKISFFTYAGEVQAVRGISYKVKKGEVLGIVGESGMGDRFLRRTFSTFQLTDDNKRAAAAARRYAEGFDAMLPQPGRQEPGRNGLFIAGPPAPARPTSPLPSPTT